MLLCIAIKALLCWLCFCRFPQWLWGQIVKPPYFSRTLGIEPPNRPPRVRIRCSLSIKPKKTAHFVCASNIKLRWTVLFTHYRLPSSDFHKALHVFFSIVSHLWFKRIFSDHRFEDASGYVRQEACWEGFQEGKFKFKFKFKFTYLQSLSLIHQALLC